MAENDQKKKPMANSKIPKFGGWNGGEDGGYTVCFDSARKGKAGGTNPNEMFLDNDMDLKINPNEMFLDNDMEAEAAAPSRPPPKVQNKQPKFGVWNEEGESEIPYTAYFEKTTKDQQKFNPNDPQMNRDMAAAPTSKPGIKQQQQQTPKFGEWNEGEESGPYSAYFDNPRGNKVNTTSTEPRMNRDMVKPPPPAPATSRQNPNQPKFGEWNEGEESGPYTGYFENPRGNKQVNAAPTEPQMNRDMATKLPPPQTRPTNPNEPEFGVWDEDTPYTAYFDKPKKDKTTTTEPQMNRDMAKPPPAANAPPSVVGRVDPRANEPQPAGYGGGRGGGRRGQQVQFSSGRTSAEPSPTHPKTGGRGGGGGGYAAAPKKSPLHNAAQGPSVPEFGDWTKNENYTEIFGQIKENGTVGPSPYHYRTTQPERKPKGGCLSWLFP